MPRDILVPVGLITRPGKLGVFSPGALAVAENVLLRSKGQLERVRDLGDESVGVAGGTLTPEIVLPLPSPQFTYLGFFNGTNPLTLWGASTTALFQDLTSSLALPRLIGRAFWFGMRGRLYMNTQKGIVVHDYLNPSTASERLPRVAGLVPPLAVITPITGTGATFPVSTSAQWVAVGYRKFDGYEVKSPPGPPFYADSAAAAREYFQVDLVFGSGYAAGDEIRVYRTVTRPTGTDPGSQYYLAFSGILTAGNIASGGVTGIHDAVPDTALGEDLYTNEGVEGADQTDDAPPYAETLATFKGYGFYANLKQPPRFTTSIPFRAVPDPLVPTELAIPAAERGTAIGRRILSATVTNGSAVVTAISAADIIGLKIGQFVERVSGAGGPISAFITAVGVTTITLTGTLPNATGAAILRTTDQIWTSTGVTAVASGLASVSQMIGNIYAQHNHIIASADILSDPSVAQNFTATVTLQVAPFLRGSMHIAVTNGQNLTPPVTVPTTPPPTVGVDMLTVAPESTPNAFAWSKPQLPEAVPPLQQDRCGSGTILKIDATQSALYFWCTDGLWRLTGDGGDWALDQIDSSTLLHSPQASCVYRDQVWGYTNRGLVSADAASGVNADISDQLIGDVLPPAALSDPTSAAVQVTPNEYFDELWLSIDAVGTARTFYVWNVVTQAFTTVLFPIGASIDTVYAVGYDRARSRILFGMSRTSANQVVVSSLRSDSPSTFSRPSRVEFQPLYSGDAGSTKQWISAEYVFDPASQTLAITPTFSGVDNPALALRSRGGGDSRTSSYVPRAAFALGESIRVGWKTSHTSQSRFFGVLPRFTPGSEQELQR